MRFVRLLPLLLVLGHGLASAQEHFYIPNPEFTPGTINRAVTQSNLAQTVFAPGWTKTVRPPSSYIDRLKREQLTRLGRQGAPEDYHEDHRVPLCAGGEPRDPHNLWPQPIEGVWRDADKNQLEASVCRQVCRGDITLERAQAIFLAPDWTKEYEKFFPVDH